jgi:hypothetical protein
MSSEGAEGEFNPPVEEHDGMRLRTQSTAALDAIRKISANVDA